MLVCTCSKCDYQFNIDNIKIHIGTKFWIIDYAYFICPRCWNKIVLPEQYYEYFGIEYDS